MPKKPNVLAPKYIAIKVATGCISKAVPRIFASRKLRNKLIIKNIAKMAIPRANFCVTNKHKAQGRIINPDPKKGIMSKNATIAAVPIGFLILTIKNPTENKKKQIIISSMQDLIYLTITLIVLFFVFSKIFLIFFGNKLIINSVIFS